MKNNSPIANRFQKNVARLKSWLKSEKIEAWRLYEKDIPEFPYIVDIYLDNAVVYEKGKRLEDTTEGAQLKDRHVSEIFQALTDVMQIKRENIFFKERKRQSGSSQYTAISSASRIISVVENGLKFEINLSDYLDTGLFLDHRPFRKELLKMTGQGKSLLNLFSYTSSISVCGAKAGFATTSVDMSKTYIDWSVRNFQLNGLPLTGHHFVNDNALEYLSSPKDKFDLIFLDPPSFSNSKRMEDTFDVIRDQQQLIENTMRHLKPDGVLYFSNNAKKFKLDDTIAAKYQVNDITGRSIPVDFRDQKIHCLFKISYK